MLDILAECITEHLCQNSVTGIRYSPIYVLYKCNREKNKNNQFIIFYTLIWHWWESFGTLYYAEKERSHFTFIVVFKKDRLRTQLTQFGRLNPGGILVELKYIRNLLFSRWKHLISFQGKTKRKHDKKTDGSGKFSSSISRWTTALAAPEIICEMLQVLIFRMLDCTGGINRLHTSDNWKHLLPLQ